MIYLNINGYAGVGKSTVIDLITKEYKTLWIPRITSRAPRQGEKLDAEYEFVTDAEFWRRYHDGGLIRDSVHQVMVGHTSMGGGYFTAIPHPTTWPHPAEDVELLLSTFGYFSSRMKYHYNLGMVNIFITVHDKEELRRRLKQRNRKLGLNFIEQWKKNLKHFEENPEKDYDFVVYNDGTPKECAEEISRIINLLARLVCRAV